MSDGAVNNLDPKPGTPANNGAAAGKNVSAPASALTSAAARPAAAAAADPATPAAPPTPPPPAPVPAALAHMKLPLQGADFSLKGYHAEATVTPDQVVATAEQLDKEGFSIDTMTGVDWMAQGQMEVVYDYFHPDKPLRVVVRTRVPRDNPELPTISGVFPGANWHERETHDFFGIRFTGHPDLSPFLLPEDATYHPLRKDFKSCS
jgi:NADH:ubiquinone oxidoreductase subunit C